MCLKRASHFWREEKFLGLGSGWFGLGPSVTSPLAPPPPPLRCSANPPGHSVDQGRPGPRAAQAVCKIAPALAAGCAVVLKPSPLASLTCVRFGECALAAGLPPGALNVITGGPPGGDAGHALVAHAGLAKVSFTGSSAAGRAILRASADLLRPTALELGGKGCMIVFDDAALDSVVDWAMFGIFGCAGQICSANSRLLVHRSVAAELAAALRAGAGRVRVGDPLDAATQMGPVVSAAQQQKVLGYIAGARAAGCAVWQAEGQLPADPALAGGYFVPPTVVTEVPLDAAVWREEVFGPVVALNTFDTEAEVVTASPLHVLLSTQSQKRASNSAHLTPELQEPRAILQNPDFFFLSRTAGPPTANRRPTAANCHNHHPPAANCRQPPTFEVEQVP